MTTSGRPGPCRRAQIWWDARCDARGGLTPDEGSPRAKSYESAADARCEVIKHILVRELEQMEAALAQLEADRQSLVEMWPDVAKQGAQAVVVDAPGHNSLTEVLHQVPRQAAAPEMAGEAVDLADPAMRSSIRLAGQRCAVQEELRRLSIEAAGLTKIIQAKKDAAKAEQEAERKLGAVCRDIYLATLARYVSEYSAGVSRTGLRARSAASDGPRHGIS